MQGSCLREFFIRYRIIILFVATAAFVLPEVSVYFHRPARGTDIFGYIKAGKDALQKADLYKDSAPGINNTWPPFFSFFMMPLALSVEHLGLPISKELWYFFNFFCLIAVIKLWSEMLYGERPKFSSKSAFDFSSPKVFVPFLLVLPSFVANFFMLQINVFILFLVTLGVYFLLKKKDIGAGIAFGFAGALKVFPALVVPYLLLRRQWKVAAYAIAAGAVLSVLPVLIYGVDQFIELFKHWVSISLQQTLIVDNERHNNQSLYAMCYRLLAYQLKVTEGGSSMIKMANLASVALIVFGAFGVFLRNRFEFLNTRTILVEFACLCIMMIIFPPIGWGHYFVFLYPTVAIVWCSYLNDPEFFMKVKFSKYAAIGWGLLIFLPYVGGAAIDNFAKANSNYTLAGLMALVLLLSMIPYFNNQAATSQSKVNG